MRPPEFIGSNYLCDSSLNGSFSISPAKWEADQSFKQLWSTHKTCIGNVSAENNHVWPEWQSADGTVEAVPGSFAMDVTGRADECSLKPVTQTSEPLEVRLMGGQDTFNEQVGVVRLALQVHAS